MLKKLQKFLSPDYSLQVVSFEVELLNFHYHTWYISHLIHEAIHFYFFMRLSGWKFWCFQASYSKFLIVSLRLDFLRQGSWTITTIYDIVTLLFMRQFISSFFFSFFFFRLVWWMRMRLKVPLSSWYYSLFWSSYSKLLLCLNWIRWGQSVQLSLP